MKKKKLSALDGAQNWNSSVNQLRSSMQKASNAFLNSCEQCLKIESKPQLKQMKISSSAELLENQP